MLRNICVFCGAHAGANPSYAIAARRLGTAIAQSGRRLVFGGGHVGLMGAVADAVLEAGGEAIGVIPQQLVDREIAHTGLTEIRIVHSMHERKALMAELADAFVALPGGLGTLDEIFEIWTWAQLGIHRKPYGFLNAAGYYARLLDFLDHAVAENFVRAENHAALIVEEEAERLLARLDAQPLPDFPQWIERVRP